MLKIGKDAKDVNYFKGEDVLFDEGVLKSFKRK